MSTPRVCCYSVAQPGRVGRHMTSVHVLCQTYLSGPGVRIWRGPALIPCGRGSTQARPARCCHELQRRGPPRSRRSPLEGARLALPVERPPQHILLSPASLSPSTAACSATRLGMPRAHAAARRWRAAASPAHSLRGCHPRTGDPPPPPERPPAPRRAPPSWTADAPQHFVSPPHRPRFECGVVARPLPARLVEGGDAGGGGVGGGGGGGLVVSWLGARRRRCRTRPSAAVPIPFPLAWVGLWLWQGAPREGERDGNRRHRPAQPHLSTPPARAAR